MYHVTITMPLSGTICRRLAGTSCDQTVYPVQNLYVHPLRRYTSISAYADAPRDAASRTTDHIALPIKFNYQAMSVDSKLLHTPGNVAYYQICDR